METKPLPTSKIANCPLTHALSLIGGKWRLAIIWAIHQRGTVRYNELKRAVEGVTNMMLTQALKDLEQQKIITRVQYLEVPPRVEYSLTKEGQDLIPALKALATWGKAMQGINEI